MSTCFVEIHQKQKRRSHYQPQPLDNLQLTDRDIYRVLKPLYYYRFLRTSQILALIGESEQVLRKRLRKLMDHQYILRVPDPEQHYFVGGSREKVYGITTQGTRVLMDKRLIAPDRTDWTRRNREAGERTATGRRVIPHALAVARVMTAIARACRSSSGRMRYIAGHELVAAAQGAPGHPVVSWTVTVPSSQGREQTFTVKPDQLFGVEFAHLPAGRNTSFFLLEVDRSSEPVRRAALKQSAVYKKLLLYAWTHVHTLLEPAFGIKGFRVLTVTTQRARVQTMLAAYHHLSQQVMPTWETRRCPAGVFLFTDFASLHPENLFASPWVDGKGRDVILLQTHDESEAFFAALHRAVQASAYGSLPAAARVLYLRLFSEPSVAPSPDVYHLSLFVSASVWGKVLELKLPCGEMTIKPGDARMATVLTANEQVVRHSESVLHELEQRAAALDMRVQVLAS